MEIGKKLKEARQMSGLTQENVAEKLNVSRQTISNWETEKFYPDILYVLQLSDLYQVSLDELLKGDERMIQHLEDSTNVVKSNQKILLAFICNICLLFLFFIFIIPISKSYLLTLIGLLVVTNGLFVYQLFKLVELDAAVRVG
ncbi:MULTISPECIES: helix-turn-helix transcriptional regulator [Streptococcus]|uniref:helix-turn-helix transcriptional regulator n=1 Tax=Streptococcus TaxID=1301 RepID=UPI000FEF29B7|nr:helix-turn-helix transcriptional regulator [Streptococcus anginosus]RHE84169.1 XRE family transcriptional regulator [Streptococcus anginosus]